MEQEHFFQGYCRCLDHSRTVTAITAEGKLTEADCSFGACPYEASCAIAKELAQLKNK